LPKQRKKNSTENSTERLYNNGLWTEGRYNTFITSALRAGARRWPPKYKTLNNAKTEKRVNPKTGRLAQFYLCNGCGGEFTQKDVEVDHINPVVSPAKGFISWDVFINNLYCETDNLQCLCKTCHKAKTLKEKKTRNADQSDN